MPNGRLIEAVPINADSCWLLFREGDYENYKPETLWKYDAGRLEEFASVKANAVSYDAVTGTTYALKLRNGAVQILVSRDGGLSWTEEVPKLESPSGTYRADQAIPRVAAGVLYFATSDTDGDPLAGAVYRRTGPPGAGEYELLLYCPAGPHFGGFNSLAVNGRGRILGVGFWTSVYYDGDGWVQESLPDKNDFYDVALGLNGYYALARNERATIELLYHP